MVFASKARAELGRPKPWKNIARRARSGDLPQCRNAWHSGQAGHRATKGSANSVVCAHVVSCVEGCGGVRGGSVKIGSKVEAVLWGNKAWRGARWAWQEGRQSTDGTGSRRRKWNMRQGAEELEGANGAPAAASKGEQAWERRLPRASSTEGESGESGECIGSLITRK